MKKFFYILGAILLLVACKGEEIGGQEPVGPGLADHAIDFQAAALTSSAAGDKATRGTLIGSTGASQPNDDDGQQRWTSPWVSGDVMSVNALYYFDSMTLLGQQFMAEQEVRCHVAGDPAVTAWQYAPVKYWPNQGYLDFYAQYPSMKTLAGIVPTTNGLSSLRYWHESPLDTVLTFRYYALPAAKAAPTLNDMDNPIEDKLVTDVFNDAEAQPDLMFAHHPHLSKPAVSSKVDFSFTHAMMGVRFWIKGLDNQDASSDASHYSWFRNVQDFKIESVSFGPVYTGGEVIAFDNTNWQKYYDGKDEATQTSTEPVKLRYLWNFGSQKVMLPDGTTTDMTTPAYGGYRKKYDKAPGTPLWSVDYVHNPIDLGYGIEAKASTFSQTCDNSLKAKFPWIESKSDADNLAANAFPDKKSEEKWIPKSSFPLLPVMDTERRVDAVQSAFIFPPQFFAPGVKYIRVTFTMVDDDDSTLTHTLDAPISMTEKDAWWDSGRQMLRVEDGEILDLYFTFSIDGDEYFKFLVDAQVTPWQKGGEQTEEWKNW